MLLFLNVFHILLCVVLILIILLQPGKGADLGSSFGGGGGSSSIFGPRGAGNLLSRTTTVVAFLFMATSISLALYSNTAVRSGTDIEEEIRKLQEEEAQEAHKSKMMEILNEEPPVEEPPALEMPVPSLDELPPPTGPMGPALPEGMPEEPAPTEPEGSPAP